MRRPARKRIASSPKADREKVARACDAPLPPSGVQQAAATGSAGILPASAGACDAPLPPSGTRKVDRESGAQTSGRESNPIDFAAAEEMFATAIMRPMTSGHHMQRTWTDGRSMKDVAAEFIKPNDRLSSYERLEIYNRQYWFRLVDCMYEDFPGLLATIGPKKFDALITEYLIRFPSTSFTLRNLGSRLVEFIAAEPQWVAPHGRLALDMARMEWAWIVAFDEEARQPLKQDDIKGRDPESLTLKLQPYVTLLELDYPLDDYLISLKKVEHLRTEASTGHAHHATRRSRIPLPKRERVFIAVHRCDNTVYYKRLEPPEYSVLKALESGKSVAEACALALTGPATSSSSVEELSSKVSEWFATWNELGWLCV